MALVDTQGFVMAVDRSLFGPQGRRWIERKLPDVVTNLAFIGVSAVGALILAFHVSCIEGPSPTESTSLHRFTYAAALLVEVSNSSQHGVVVDTVGFMPCQQSLHLMQWCSVCNSVGKRYYCLYKVV